MDDYPLWFASQQEERVYRVLADFKNKNYISGFLYQVPVLGYFDLRGAIILDFLVFNPFETACQIHGEHWHEGELGSDDMLQLQVLKSLFQVVCTFWEDELEDYEMTRNILRQWLVLNAGASKE